MAMINVNGSPVHLVLAKDRLRSLKRGHPWIFPDVLANLPPAPSGSLALLKSKEGEILAKGYYDPQSKLCFRAFVLNKDRLDDDLVAGRIGRAVALRARLFDPAITNGFRLLNGEGDGLPGLICDIYNDTAVLKLDGAGAETFYNLPGICDLLQRSYSLRTCWLKHRSSRSNSGSSSSSSGSSSAGAEDAGDAWDDAESFGSSSSGSSGGGGTGGSRQGLGGGRKGSSNRDSSRSSSSSGYGGGQGGDSRGGQGSGFRTYDNGQGTLGGSSRPFQRDSSRGGGGGGPAGRRPVQALSVEPVAGDWAQPTVIARPDRGQLIAGDYPGKPVLFKENGAVFQADVVMGQKTGFFLDQRDNRAMLGRLCRGSRVLNVFAYTGGFSIYAGLAGAAHVTTVDLARPALEFASANWALNGLDPRKHITEAADAFAFLDAAASARERYDVVVVDPPSFAPNKASVEKAVASYERVFAMGAAVTASGGILALASCSSHIPFPRFMEMCEEAVCGKARRVASVLGVHAQPADHPYPAACDELRYLKFVLYRLD